MASAADREDRIGDVTPELMLEWSDGLEDERAKFVAIAESMKAQGISALTIDGFSKIKLARTKLVEFRAAIAKAITLTENPK